MVRILHVNDVTWKNVDSFIMEHGKFFIW